MKGPRRALALTGTVYLLVIAGLGDAPIRADSAPPAPTISVTRNSALYGSVWPVDLNGDGITDLVASDTTSNGNPESILAVLGKGDGTFGSPIKSSTTGEVLAVGDFDADGKRDVVVRHVASSSSVSVLILPGNGDGTFAAPIAVGTFADVTFARSADLNGDRTLDLIICDEAALHLYPGNGDFTFGTPAVLATSKLSLGGTVADFNGDGKPDIAVANHDGGFSVSIFLNQGALTFTAADIPLDRRANDVVAADLNKDGRMDLVVATATSAVDNPDAYVDGYAYVMFGHGDGTFAMPVEYQTAAGAWKVVIGDFNRDGILDIATANRSAIYRDDCTISLKTWDTVSILPGIGDATFASRSSFSLGDQSNLLDNRFRDTVLSLNTSDLNRDGATDLIASWGAILRNNPTDPNWPPNVTASATAPAAGEITLTAPASDVDQDMLSYSWTDSAGSTSIPPVPIACVAPATGGVHTYTVTVDDGHGHTASSAVTVDFGGGGGGSTPPTIAITAPTDGSTITAGTPYAIKLHIDDPSMAVYEWTIDYSIDNGATWNHIWECHLAGQPSQPGVPTSRDESCTWNNPGPPSTHAELVAYAQDDSDASIAVSNTVRFAIAAATGAVPDPWRHQDIGGVGAAGTATFNSGVFTVSGAGADIWGTADEFQFVYRNDGYTVSDRDRNDWEITTHVDSVQNVQAWTKAGIMVRDGLAANARHASLFVTPGKGIAFQRRMSTGGTSVHTSGPALTAPVWLKLALSGTSVSAYYRKNLVDPWTLIARDRFTTGEFAQVDAGLAVTSHQDGTLATATFSQATVEPSLVLASQDIGTTGSTVSSDNVITTITSRGADVWGTSDQFTFAYTYWGLLGGSVTARVRSVTATNAWTKAGVMFRESSGIGPTYSPGGKYVFVMVTPGKGVTMQYRSTTGGSAASIGTPVAATAPGWVRITENGDTYTGYWSKDGVTWATIGSVNVSFGTANVYVGLAVTSHSTNAATASFDDLTAADR